MLQKIAVFIYHWNEQIQTPLFLLLRRITQLGGFWQPITGTREPNETLTAAALREIYEETGLTEVQLNPEPGFIFTFEKDGKKFQESVFAAQTTDTNIKLSSEHSEFIWLPFPAALQRLHWEANKQALVHIYQQILDTHYP